MKKAYSNKPLWQAATRALGIGIAFTAIGAILGYATAMFFDMALPF